MTIDTNRMYRAECVAFALHILEEHSLRLIFENDTPPDIIPFSGCVIMRNPNNAEVYDIHKLHDEYTRKHKITDPRKSLYVGVSELLDDIQMDRKNGFYTKTNNQYVELFTINHELLVHTTHNVKLDYNLY